MENSTNYNKTDFVKYLSHIENFEKLFIEGYDSQNQQILNMDKNILICGMGGSAISGEFVASLGEFYKYKKQIMVLREYQIPTYVDQEWVVIAISYSGNTEETVAMVKEIIHRNVDLYLMSSGGQFNKLALNHRLVRFNIQNGFQPRYALPLIFGSLYYVLQKIINFPAIDNNLRIEIENLDRSVDRNSISEIAKIITQKNSILLSDKINYPISLRFRCQLNENSKLIAQNYIYPEFNHNGLVGFETIQHDTYIVLLFANLHFEHQRVKLHRLFLEDYLKEKNVEVITLTTKRASPLLHILELVKLLDHISFKVAEILKINPVEVKSINLLKSNLERN